LAYFDKATILYHKEDIKLVSSAEVIVANYNVLALEKDCTDKYASAPQFGQKFKFRHLRLNRWTLGQQEKNPPQACKEKALVGVWHRSKSIAHAQELILKKNF
jgi:hypothetical protein